MQQERPRGIYVAAACAFAFDVHHALLSTVFPPHGQVLVEALPPKWEGKLLFAEHMAGLVSTVSGGVPPPAGVASLFSFQPPPWRSGGSNFDRPTEGGNISYFSKSNRDI